MLVFVSLGFKPPLRRSRRRALSSASEARVGGCVCIPRAEMLFCAAARWMTTRASKSASSAESGGWGWFQASQRENAFFSCRRPAAAARAAAAVAAPPPPPLSSHARARRDVCAAASMASKSSDGGKGGGRTGVGSLIGTYANPLRNVSSSSSSSSQRRGGNQSSTEGTMPRSGLLLRDYMHRCLYDRTDGYFTQPEAPVGEIGASINFNSLLGQEDYARVLDARYARLTSQW